MKRICLCLLVIVNIFCCSCSLNRQESNIDPSVSNDASQNLANDSIVISTAPVETCLTNTYTIEQLQSYFGPYCTISENSWAGVVSDLGVYNFKNVHATFPHSCLRQYADEKGEYYFVYSIYKVAEGGYYYVFWGGYRKESNVDINSWMLESKACLMLYVTELKSLDDFSSIEVGKSTATDVINIDSAGSFDFGMGRGTPSWHVLNDGSILEILYTLNDDFFKTHKRDDMIVKSIEIVDRSTTRCYLAYVDPDDLPKT